MSDSKSSNVVNATDATFKDIVNKSKTPVLVDFWSTTCIPCKSLAPVLDEVSVQRGEELLIVKVNMEDAPEIFRQNRIRGVPFLQLIVDGEVEAQTQGAMGKDQLNDWIDGNL